MIAVGQRVEGQPGTLHPPGLEHGFLRWARVP
jgi:hypothetical protein